MLSLLLIAGAIQPNVFAASYCQLRRYGIDDATARGVAVRYAYRHDLPDPLMTDGVRADVKEAVSALLKLCPEV